MKIKIFVADNKQEAINNLLKEGYKVATMKEVWDLKEKKQIPAQWYDTNLVFIKGTIRLATEKELRNLHDFYGVDGRLLTLGGNYVDDLVGDSNLDIRGARFVGVKK